MWEGTRGEAKGLAPEKRRKKKEIVSVIIIIGY
jgi:hypothetical protein